MEIDNAQAKRSLDAIDHVTRLAERHSQNNGVLQMAWSAAIFLALSGFDAALWLAPRLWPTQDWTWSAIMLAGGFFVAVGLSSAAWINRYVKSLPVRPARIANRWVRMGEQSGTRSQSGNGWWGLYHVIVVLGGIGLAVYAVAAHHVHFPIPFMFTVIGLIDSAPLCITGYLQWRNTHLEEAA